MCLSCKIQIQSHKKKEELSQSRSNSVCQQSTNEILKRITTIKIQSLCVCLVKYRYNLIKKDYTIKSNLSCWSCTKQILKRVSTFKNPTRCNMWVQCKSEILSRQTLTCFLHDEVENCITHSLKIRLGLGLSRLTPLRLGLGLSRLTPGYHV